MNRQRAFAGALLVQAGLGSILSWAMLFTRLHGTASRNFPYSNCETVLTSGLLAFAMAVLASGILAEKIGPRKLAASSAVLAAAGFTLGAFADVASLIEAAVVSSALGASAGAVYVTTMATAMRWYPEKKGIIAGAILSGSAFAGLFWFRISEQLLRLLDVQGAFLAIGAGSALMILGGGWYLANPPAGYVPPVWRRPETQAPGPSESGFDWGQMLRRSSLYLICAAMSLLSSSAIAYSANIQFMSSLLISRGLELQLAERVTLLAALIFAISDGMGRIAWGALSDSIGLWLSLFALCAVEVIVIALVWRAGGNGSVLIFGAFALGTAFGGLMVIFPCLVSECLGEARFTETYSLAFAVFVIFSVGIIFGSGSLHSAVSSLAWLDAILFSSVLPMAGAAALFIVKRSKGKASPVYDEIQPEDEVEEKSYD